MSKYINVGYLFFQELERILSAGITDMQIENVDQVPDDFDGQAWLGVYNRGCLIRLNSETLQLEKSQGYEERVYNFSILLALRDGRTDQLNISDFTEEVKYYLKDAKHNGDIWQHLSAIETTFDELSELNLQNNIKTATLTLGILRDG